LLTMMANLQRRCSAEKPRGAAGGLGLGFSRPRTERTASRLWCGSRTLAGLLPTDRGQGSMVRILGCGSQMHPPPQASLPRRCSTEKPRGEGSRWGVVSDHGLLGQGAWLGGCRPLAHHDGQLAASLQRRETSRREDSGWASPDRGPSARPADCGAGAGHWLCFSRQRTGQHGQDTRVREAPTTSGQPTAPLQHRETSRSGVDSDNSTTGSGAWLGGCRPLYSP
jgi:hypothetical protein